MSIMATRYMLGCDYGSVDENTTPTVKDFQALHDAGYRVIGLRAAYYYDGAHPPR